MFSCSHGGRLCVCGHIKADHDDGKWCVSCDATVLAPELRCFKFRDRAPDTAPKEEKIPVIQNQRGIEAKRIWV